MKYIQRLCVIIVALASLHARAGSSPFPPAFLDISPAARFCRLALARLTIEHMHTSGCLQELGQAERFEFFTRFRLACLDLVGAQLDPYDLEPGQFASLFAGLCEQFCPTTRR